MLDVQQMLNKENILEEQKATAEEFYIRCIINQINSRDLYKIEEYNRLIEKHSDKYTWAKRP